MRVFQVGKRERKQHHVSSSIEWLPFQNIDLPTNRTINFYYNTLATFILKSYISKVIVPKSDWKGGGVSRAKTKKYIFQRRMQHLFHALKRKKKKLASHVLSVSDLEVVLPMLACLVLGNYPTHSLISSSFWVPLVSKRRTLSNSELQPAPFDHLYRRQRGRVDWALDLKSGHPKFEPRSHSQLDLFAFSAPRIHIQLICAQVPLTPIFFC